MNRCAPGVDTACFQYSLGFIPPNIMRLVAHVQWFIGADPNFAGLLNLDHFPDGRSPKDTASCWYAHHFDHRPATDRVTTIMLPLADDVYPKTVVHELGHALHEALGWDHEALPVSWYAKTDRWEAFAEAFTAWIMPPMLGDLGAHWDEHYGPARDLLYRDDPATVALFESLAAE